LNTEYGERKVIEVTYMILDSSFGRYKLSTKFMKSTTYIIVPQAKPFIVTGALFKQDCCGNSLEGCFIHPI